MTREEAIKILRREIECLSHTKCEDCILQVACDPIKTTPYDSEYIEVYEMAITALEQEPTEEERALLQKWRDNRGISIEDFEDALNTLQEPKTGKWIDTEFRKQEYFLAGKCSVCGKVRVIDKFCSHCGAKMIEPQESEDEE